MECTRWHKNQQAYLEVIWKENKTDDVICLHFGVYGNICGHMIPSSETVGNNHIARKYWIHSDSLKFCSFSFVKYTESETYSDDFQFLDIATVILIFSHKKIK